MTGRTAPSTRWSYKKPGLEVISMGPHHDRKRRGGILHKLEGEKVLMRIHMSESDGYEGKLAYQAIVALLRERHLAGTTVLRGSMSFGSHSQLHTDRIEVLSYDMPIAIECVDSEENIRAILPQLDAMIGGGMITLERADVIVYRAGEEEGNPDLH